MFIKGNGAIMSWLGYAILSAVAAAATTVLAKIGVESVPSNVATAVRTAVILLFVGGLVLVRGEFRSFTAIAPRSLVFLVLSGCATGLSWLAYFRALQLGPASAVAPIDKLSLPMAVALAAIFLGEPMSWRLALGVALMVAGALLTLRP
jgi:transporter family protein